MKKWIGIIGISILLIAAFLGYRFYNFIYAPNVILDGETDFVYIHSGSDFDELVDSLTSKEIISSEKSFRWLSSVMKYNTPKPGKYQISNNWNNRELITHLRSGEQIAVRLSFNNLRTIDELCEIHSHEIRI